MLWCHITSNHYWYHTALITSYVSWYTDINIWYDSVIWQDMIVSYDMKWCHGVYHFSRTRGWRLTRFLQICKMYFSVLVAILSQPSVPGHAKTSQISSEDQWCTANCGGDVGKRKHCDAQSFKQHRRSALLFFKVISQISRSHGTQKLPILIRIERFRTVTPVWIDWWLWNVTQSLKNHISSIMIR